MTLVIDESPSREIEVIEEPIQILECSEETEEQSRTCDKLAWPFFI